MKCEIEWHYSLESLTPPANFADDAGAGWLLEQAQAHGLTTLLAHADDGVIWGKVENGRLALSDKVFKDVSPPLREATLQELRLFGPKAELFVWRADYGGWRGRLIDDGGTEIRGWSFLEQHLQWGDRLERVEGGFSLVREGQLGMRHALPMALEEGIFDPEADKHPIRLCVRHYLARDDDGALYIDQGRLVRLFIEGDEEACDE
jgi:CRISPR-associated protein (TIGR03984 family)